MIKRQLDEPFARNRPQAADFIPNDLRKLGVVGGHAFQVTHRGAGHQPWEGSRPRDPRFPEPSVFVGRATGICLEAWHVFAAREDPTSLPLFEHYLLLTRLCRTGSAPSRSRGGRPAPYVGVPSARPFFSFEWLRCW